MTLGLNAFVEAPSGSFRELIGFRFVEWTEGFAAAELEVGPPHLNRGGILHGGALCVLIDSVCGAAGIWSPDPERIRKSVTLSLNTTFTGQCRAGLIRAEARVRSAGRSIYTSAAEVRGPDEALLAHGLGVFKWLRGSETSEGGEGYSA